MIEEISDLEFENLKQFKGTPKEYIEEISRLGWSDPLRVEDAVDELTAKPVKKVSFVSHGWSGNEHLQGILSRTLFHIWWWHSSYRGGLDIYYVPDICWDSAEWVQTWTPLCGG